MLASLGIQSGVKLFANISEVSRLDEEARPSSINLFSIQGLLLWINNVLFH